MYNRFPMARTTGFQWLVSLSGAPMQNCEFIYSATTISAPKSQYHFKHLQFEPCVPFLEATVAAKYIKCASYSNLALLMNVFPMFHSVCICLSKANIGSYSNSYLISYLFHIFFIFLFCFPHICISIFCNVIYIILIIFCFV